MRTIIGAFYEVYNRLGYGYLESHYAAALERELNGAGKQVAREYAVRVLYKGEEIGFHRLDMVVESAVVVELKSTPVLAPIARRQLYNYLRATNLEAGLLLYFGPEPRFQKVFVLNRLGPIDVGIKQKTRS
jgi:GxxExxY protein